MKITGFIWLERIVQKLIWKHSVQMEEVRELFLNQSRFHFVENGQRKGENVSAAHGQTEAGQSICFVISLERIIIERWLCRQGI